MHLPFYRHQHRCRAIHERKAEQLKRIACYPYRLLQDVSYSIQHRHEFVARFENPPPVIDPFLNHTGPFRLTDLPLEILLLIFEFLPTYERNTNHLSGRLDAYTYSPSLRSLLLVSKGISASATLVLYLPSRIPKRLVLPFEARGNVGWPWGTPLHLAAYKGFLTTAMHLHLLTQIDIDATDSMGRTPLYLAARSGNVDVVKFLISHGAAVNSTVADSLPLCPLSSAPRPIWFRHATPLHAAAQGGGCEVVKVLLESGADATAAASLTTIASWTWILSTLPRSIRPLQTAALVGSVDVVRLLLDHASPGKDDFDMAVHFATVAGCADAVKVLLAHRPGQTGLNVRPLGISLLHIAARCGFEDVIEFLLRDGARIDERDLLDRTPLLDASLAGCLPAVRALVDNGADTYDTRISEWIAVEICNRGLRGDRYNEVLRVLWAKTPRETTKEWWENERCREGIRSRRWSFGYSPPSQEHLERLHVYLAGLPGEAGDD